MRSYSRLAVVEQLTSKFPEFWKYFWRSNDDKNPCNNAVAQSLDIQVTEIFQFRFTLQRCTTWSQTFRQIETNPGTGTGINRQIAVIINRRFVTGSRLNLSSQFTVSPIVSHSQVFKNYADSKSRHNKKKLKRLNDKKDKKSRKSNKSETITSADISPVPCPVDTTAVTNEVIEEERTNETGEERVVKKSKKSKASNDEEDSHRDRKKSRKNKLSIEKPDKRSKRKHKKKLKQMAKEMRVPDSREDFLKKMAIEELPIAFESTKMSKRNRRNSDDVSLHSYRCNDSDSQSDNDNKVEQNISSQLSKKLSEIKKKKQKVIVEDLTEFQIEHLRNAQVPFVEVKQCSRRTQRKNEAKFNNLADKLVNKMSIL